MSLLHRHNYILWRVSGLEFNVVALRPGVWYHQNDFMTFVVPAGHVVLYQEQAYYPGDMVEADEFMLFTEEAFVALDTEEDLLNS